FSNTTYIYQFFLSVLFISLCKASANNDIIIGTVDKGRYGLPGDVMSMTGMFVLTLPFRMGIDPAMSFEAFYKKIINKKRKINVNKRYPIGLIKEDLAAIHKKDMDLFDVILCYEEVDFSINDSGSKLTIDWLFKETIATPIVSYVINEKDGTLTLKFYHQIDYFSETEIDDLYNDMVLLINRVLDNPQITIEDLLI
ncbi:MAG: hypothetical protein GY754_37655, partial [bacterium]|nr:hypothetical protein [bacterium]